MIIKENVLTKNSIEFASDRDLWDFLDEHEEITSGYYQVIHFPDGKIVIRY